MSPDAEYRERLAAGAISFQRCADGHAVFPPRLACPACHDRALAWHDASGGAVIYSATTISPRDAAPYTVVVLDADEGFRLMSRIDGPDAGTAGIGDRVTLAVRPLPGGAEPLPLVDTVEAVA